MHISSTLGVVTTLFPLLAGMWNQLVWRLTESETNLSKVPLALWHPCSTSAQLQLIGE